MVAEGRSKDPQYFYQTIKGAADEALLKGMLDAVFYFARDGAPTSPSRAVRAWNWYTVLRESADKPNLPWEDADHLNRLVEFSARLDNPHNATRTDIQRLLLNVRPEGHEAYWKTVVQAWNVAWQRNVGEAHGSTGNLSGAVPVAIYVSSPTDALVPLRPGERILAGLPNRAVPFLQTDPASLSWSDLRRLVGATVVERDELQRALSTNDREAHQEALALFASALASNMPASRLEFEVPPWVWYIAPPVALYFGGLPGYAIEQAVETLVGKGNDAAWVVRKYRQRLAAATVRDAGERLASDVT
jgi:hypothetical protein